MSLSKVEKTVIREFRKRWLYLKNKSQDNSLRRYRRGLANWFEAAKHNDCVSLARKYYGINHIERMCELSDEQIIFNLSPVCGYLDVNFDDEDCPTAKELLSSEYILFDYCTADYPDNMSKLDEIYLEDVDTSELIAACYTSNCKSVHYDDWAERVGGFYPFFLGILMKSTGEVFSKKEARMLTESVVSNVSGAYLNELFVYEVVHQGNQMVVSIDTDNPVSYIEPIKTAIIELSHKSIARMVKDLLSTDETLPKDLLKAINTYSKQRRPNIELFKRRLACLLAKKQDSYDILVFEEAISKFLFEGQSYYHYRGGGVRFL